MSLFERTKKWLRSSSTQMQTSAEAPRDAGLDLEQAYRAYGDGARFVDVRRADEWTQGHIAGAVHRPVDEIEADPRLTARPDEPIVTYCAAGARAERAAAALAANGYVAVRALRGGYQDWQDAGYPVELPQESTD